MTKYRVSLDAANGDAAGLVQILRSGRIRQVTFNVLPEGATAQGAGTAFNSGVEVSATGLSSFQSNGAVQPSIAATMVTLYGTAAQSVAATTNQVPIAVDFPVAVGQNIYVNVGTVFGSGGGPAVNGFVDILVAD